MDPFVLPTLGNLLGNLGELPYLGCAPTERAKRAGFNRLEKWFFNNPDFIPEFTEYIRSVKDERNAHMDKLRAEMNVILPPSLPPFLQGAIIQSGKLDANMAKYHELDKRLYGINGSMSGFLKL